jgi:NIMA-interacting peptidyl-prolyl cis-trans isomerase 4
MGQVTSVCQIHCSHSTGGALGWKTKGSLDPQFEAVAYGLEASSTGNPKYGEAKTGFGYHIIMVEGRK